MVLDQMECLHTLHLDRTWPWPTGLRPVHLHMRSTTRPCRHRQCLQMEMKDIITWIKTETSCRCTIQTRHTRLDQNMALDNRNHTTRINKEPCGEFQLVQWQLAPMRTTTICNSNHHILLDLLRLNRCKTYLNHINHQCHHSHRELHHWVRYRSQMDHQALFPP
jgi:hypothetical protein